MSRGMLFLMLMLMGALCTLTACGTLGKLNFGLSVDPDLCVSLAVQWETSEVSAEHICAEDIEAALAKLQQQKGKKITGKPVITSLYGNPPRLLQPQPLTVPLQQP